MDLDSPLYGQRIKVTKHTPPPVQPPSTITVTIPLDKARTILSAMDALNGLRYGYRGATVGQDFEPFFELFNALTAITR